jgi:hypothetical protein
MLRTPIAVKVGRSRATGDKPIGGVSGDGVLENLVDLGQPATVGRRVADMLDGGGGQTASVVYLHEVPAAELGMQLDGVQPAVGVRGIVGHGAFRVGDVAVLTGGNALSAFVDAQ